MEAKVEVTQTTGGGIPTSMSLGALVFQLFQPALPACTSEKGQNMPESFIQLRRT